MHEMAGSIFAYVAYYLVKHPDIPVCKQKCVWVGQKFGQVDSNGKVYPGGFVREQDSYNIFELLTFKGDHDNCFKRHTD